MQCANCGEEIVDTKPQKPLSSIRIDLATLRMKCVEWMQAGAKSVPLDEFLNHLHEVYHEQ